MRKLKILFCLIALIQTPVSAYAEEDESGSESGSSFESLVRDLSSSRASGIAGNDQDPFDQVKIHFGIGLVTSYLSYESNIGPVRGTHQGVQASLGIDLFSPNWMAEGVVRSFSETEIDNTRASLHEFDIKILYSFNSHTSLVPFMGMGMAARYLDVTDKTLNKYTTPASIFCLGSAFNINGNLSLAGEVSYRRPFSDETIERSAADITVRLNTHF